MYDKIQQLQQLDSSDEDDQPIFLQPLPQHTTPTKPENTLSTSIKSAMFNLKYNIIHSNYVPLLSCQRKPISIQDDASSGYLMGKSYDHSSMEKFTKHFQEIVWFSYRTSNEGISDVGWGCMIRVVQMMFAEIFKRSNCQLPTTTILELFKQGKEHIFSLQNICIQGGLFERWSSCNEVVSIVSSILKNPLKIKELESKLNIQIHNEIDVYHGIMDLRGSEDQQQHFPKIVFISTSKFSNNTEGSDQKYHSHFQHLMKLNSFCGAASGIGQQALFIVGYYEEKAIILDPHYAQQQNNQENVKYFKKTPRGIDLKKLESSFCLCYYFSSLQEYKAWVIELVYLQRIYSPYTIFTVNTENNDEIEKNRKRSEDFEVL